jgi:glycosyltransferase involved in cell wall biosynthesis
VKVLFFDNSTGLKTIDDLEHRARGGMISSLFRLSDELQRRGVKCWVYSGVKTGGLKNGVWWFHKDEDPAQFHFDIIVFNRTTHDGQPHIRAKHRVLWTHDLPHHGFIPKQSIVKAFSKIVFMSHYAERVWRAFYPLIGKSVIIPNGVDRDVFYPRKKDLDYMIYGSAPNRGLHHLPLFYDAVKYRTRGSVYLRAYSHLESLHPQEKADEDRFWAEDFNETYKGLDDSDVDLRKPLQQKEYAGQLGRASLMVLPTTYPEICSNSILQALASGVPIVTTGNIGSAAEWIKSGWNGYMTDFHPYDYMIFQVQMVRGAVKILNHPTIHNRMIKNAAKTPRIYDWVEIARKWHKMFKRL